MGKAPNNHGLNPHAFPSPIRDLVDQDYAHTLGAADKAWLAAFNDAHYAADFRGSVGCCFTKAQRKAANDAKNAARRDLTQQMAALGLLEVWEPLEAERE